MKLKLILWILPVILLISFISINHVNGEDVDYSKIGEKVVQEIEKTGLQLIGTIPMDPNVTQYDIEAKPLFDLPEDSVAVKAVEEILSQVKL